MDSGPRNGLSAKNRRAASPRALPARSRALFLLAAGAAAGVALAAAGLGRSDRPRRPALPPNAVARVNETIIGTDAYQRTAAALAADRRGGLDKQQRRHVLDRLIDEELLVQRALDLGFARVDRRVRAELTRAVIASIVADYDNAQPRDAELKAFYEREGDFFRRPGRLRVRQVFQRVRNAKESEAALPRAQQAAERLRAGEDYDAVRKALGDPELSPLPDALLPASKLRDYLGPTATRTALTLKAGAVSDPVRSGYGYHVLQLLERESDTLPPFADIKRQVLVEFRRRKGEEAMRRYLDDLRTRADVVTRADLP